MKWFGNHKFFTSLIILVAIGVLLEYVGVSIGYPVGFYTVIGFFGWLLHRKGRSLWNLLWLLVPLGFIVVIVKAAKPRVVRT